jgi:riboflavin biosynthesis pyrimidine reductase
MLDAHLVDEIFLTTSPLLAGREEGDDRLALVEGAALLPAHTDEWRLASLRRHENHLFARYRR